MKDKKLSNRILRIKGQLDALLTSIDNEVVCAEVVPQFLAVKGALNSAFAVYMEEAIKNCNVRDKSQLENLINLLIKK
jgi:DNA-binding FrmR family transcriptional regulator